MTISLIVNVDSRISMKLITLLLSGLLMVGAAHAQSDDEDSQKTEQAPAVSRKVYDRIQEAQEKVDIRQYSNALKILRSLRDSGTLTDYEQRYVLNYIGYVHYYMDEINQAIAVYEEMLHIPSIEEQVRKQTLYTLAQLSTMQEDHRKALRLLNDWFALEPNPAPEPYILYAENLCHVQRYGDMVKPIETAMAIAEKHYKKIKEEWYVLLNLAKVRDTKKPCFGGYLGGMHIAEGDHLLILRVAPVYPARALSRGIEGHVDLKFTVTTAGTVKDPVILHSTSSLFDCAALEAVMKFKYRPRVVDGGAVEVHGVKTRIPFRIEE